MTEKNEINNKMRKTFNWTFIFLALFGMTFFTAQSLVGGGTSEALAAAARKSDKENRVLLVGPKKQKSVLKKLSRLIEKEVICGVSEEQLAGLSENYGAVTEEITVDGKVVTIVKISQDEAKRHELMLYLESTGSGECKPLKSHHWFYVMFSANMS